LLPLPQSSLKVSSFEIPVAFETLLDKATTNVIAPNAASEDAATSLPVKAVIQDERPNSSLATIISFLPSLACTQALVDENPQAADFELSRDEQEPIAPIVATPTLSLPVPFDIKHAQPLSFEPQSQTQNANKPEAAIQIVLNLRAMLPVAGITLAIDTQQPATISTAISAVNPQQIFADRQLDLARDHLWLDHLARDIFATRQDTNKVSFRLLPPHLGQLDVEILASDMGLMVNMTATTQEAAKIVAAAQPRLIDGLLTQGMRVNSAEISHQAMPQHSGRQSNPDAPQIAEFGTLQNTETIADEAARPTGRFA
jgi:flagellar hook-length control protein FliK